MSCRLKPVIWSCDTGQQIPCFDQVSIDHNMDANIKPIIWSMAAMLRDSTVVVRTRPREIPLLIITMRKSTHGFLFHYMVMGLRLAVLRAAGSPLQTLASGDKYGCTIDW